MKNKMKYLGIMLSLIIVFTVISGAYSPKIGDVIGQVLYTDITTKINGTPIESFSVNGRTGIYTDSLSDFSMDVTWDGDNREVLINTNAVKTNEVKNNNLLYLLFLEELKYEIVTAFETANGQFNIHLGLLKSPGQKSITYDVATLQANRREAKSQFYINSFTDTNTLYKYLKNNLPSNKIEIINEIKTKIDNAFNYYIEAANERAISNNPKDYISIDTKFWELKGKGNTEMANAIIQIDKIINNNISNFKE